MVVCQSDMEHEKKTKRCAPFLQYVFGHRCISDETVLKMKFPVELVGSVEKGSGTVTLCASF